MAAERAEDTPLLRALVAETLRVQAAMPAAEQRIGEVLSLVHGTLGWL